MSNTKSFSIGNVCLASWSGVHSIGRFTANSTTNISAVWGQDGTWYTQYNPTAQIKP
ncbi:hypothetical protein [Xylanimonas sp. McL0601]|uniref:hypothetical protein n=1 Tax=Xylanimonas sp. McL0601 TaxID=3414739 RepID=UPI003CECCF86